MSTVSSESPKVQYSVQRELSDGSLNRISVRVPYFSKDDIHVYVSDIEIKDTTVEGSKYTWRWDGDYIAITPNVDQGIEVLVRRITPIDEAIHIFDGRSEFDDQSMDENFQQLIYIAQEYSEGSGINDVFSDINMHGYKIKNVGWATDDDDVVTYGQYKQDANGAHQAKEEAKDHANKAKTYMTTAQSSAGTAVSASNRSEAILELVTHLESEAQAHAETAENAKNVSVQIKNELSTGLDNIQQISEPVRIVAANIGSVITDANSIDSINIVSSDLEGSLSDVIFDDYGDLGRHGDPVTSISGGNIKVVSDNIDAVRDNSSNMTHIVKVSTTIDQFPSMIESINGIKAQAQEARDLAKKWANHIGSPVESGEYSAKHYANEAKKNADKTDSDLTAINTAKANALKAIDASKATAVQAVTDEGSSQTTLIESSGDTQIQRVIDEGTAQVGAVGIKGTQEVQKVTAEGTKQAQAVQTEGTASAKKVTDEGTKQVGIVSAQGTTSANAVKAQQTTSTNAVVAEGDKQIKRVTTQGTTTVGLVTAEGTKQVTRVTDTGDAQVTAVQTEGTKQVDLAKAEVTKATAQTTEATKQAGIATTKASEASTSASTATAKANTATQQATLATTKASEAEDSATSASQSATAADASAKNASASAGTATAQATIATQQATASKTSADNAALSKDAAKTSETKASASAGEAKKQADLAKGYAEQAASVQVNSDWNETVSTSKAFIKNKPTLGKLASKDSIAYTEITGTPPQPDLSGLATKNELQTGLASKANTKHTHSISEVTNLQTSLNAKLDKSVFDGLVDYGDLGSP